VNDVQHILIVGCGDLGLALGQLLLAEGLAVTGVRRSEAVSSAGMHFHQADVTQPQTLVNLAKLNADILVYCVAASAQTDESYRAHYVDGLRNVLAALAHTDRLKHVFFVSSTRVFGQQTDAVLTDDTSPTPADFGGARLLEAEELLADIPCGATTLRLSGIYGPGRNRMLNLAMQPARWPPQNGWTNRIHRDDAAAFMSFLIRQVLNGQQIERAYIVTDCCPVSQYEVLMWLAGQLGVSTESVQVPEVAGGKRLGNARLLSTGFELRYPDYRAGYACEIRRNR
jgi:nucleoside-diphosphate-sugar epimerase